MVPDEAAEKENDAHPHAKECGKLSIIENMAASPKANNDDMANKEKSYHEVKKVEQDFLVTRFYDEMSKQLENVSNSPWGWCGKTEALMASHLT